MTPATVVCHRRLNGQAQRVLQFMVERGGITRRDGLELNILNVPARVLEIREAYGPDCVETEMMPEGYAVWRFRGIGETQADLFADEKILRGDVAPTRRAPHTHDRGNP